MKIINRDEIETILVISDVDTINPTTFEQLILILNALQKISNSALLMLEDFLMVVHSEIRLSIQPQIELKNKIDEIRDEYFRMLTEKGPTSIHPLNDSEEVLIDLYTQFQRVHFYSSDSCEIWNFNAFVNGRYDRR